VCYFIAFPAATYVSVLITINCCFNFQVADLKKELKGRGLSAVGNKTELVERLQLSLQGGKLNKRNDETTTIKQTLNLLKVILNQNYFQYSDKSFQPTRGIATGSSILSIIAEIYLQFFEEMCIKHWIENGEISYYKRYMNIFIIFDQSKTNENLILTHMNNIYKPLEFKITEEENNNINYLDLNIHRHNNKLSTEIHRRPT